MKIFSAAQIKKWDEATISAQEISSWELMERAANGCFEWIKTKYSISYSFCIFCGAGNNGGDGLALARMLISEGYKTQVVLLRNVHLSPDAEQNLLLLTQMAKNSIVLLDDTFDFNHISPETIIIDAIVGTGLRQPLAPTLVQIIQNINLLTNKVVAIDIPSGMSGDDAPQADALLLKADYTLTFQTYKQSFFFAESAPHLGKVVVLDIELDNLFYYENNTHFYTIDHELISRLYKPRNAFAHKGSCGTAIMVGGSYGKIGAIVLATKAALRAGAGKLYVQAPECGYNVIQSSVVEAMYLSGGTNSIEHITLLPDVVYGIGPGMGEELVTRIAFEQFLQNRQMPIVIDADGLNMIAKNKEKLLHLIPKHSILTPHPKEFERLFGKTNNSRERIAISIEMAIKYSVYIVLKGHYTAICTPDGDCYFNTTGNAGMATAGSGDVLTGIITGLLAQKYTPYEAAVLGVYLHGLAGDIAIEKMAMESLIASDLIDHLGMAFAQISTPY